MFAVRGFAISLSVFFLVYCAFSLAISCSWRRVWLYCQKYSVRRVADWLFALRMFPLLTAAIITAAFTVPSFLLLEPRSIDEPIGDVPLALGLCGAALGIVGVLNAVIAFRKASRTISAWTREAYPIETTAPVPVLRISRTLPAMTAAGIIHPKVLLSTAAEFVLTPNELHTALEHELEHVRRYDNLKKLLLRVVTFPGMAGLETAWLEVTEMAADDAAVSNAGEALDLAAALIKLSRLGPLEGPATLTAALVHSPASAVNARVARLIAWCEERRVPVQTRSPWYGLGAALATVVICAVTYSHLLVRVHTATEWLIR